MEVAQASFPRFLPEDYTITITRKHRYWVVASLEFGFQVAAGLIQIHGELRGTGPAAPSIGAAVLKVLEGVASRLHELDLRGEAHPRPSRLTRPGRAELLPSREAARLLGFSRSTLRKLAYQGRIRAERTPGGHLRFSLDAISDYLAGEGESAA